MQRLFFLDAHLVYSGKKNWDHSYQIVSLVSIQVQFAYLKMAELSPIPVPLLMIFLRFSDPVG